MQAYASEIFRQCLQLVRPCERDRSASERDALRRWWIMVSRLQTEEDLHSSGEAFLLDMQP